MIREARPADLLRLRTIQQRALSAPSAELLEEGIDGYPLTLVLEADVILGYALVVPANDVAYLAEIAVTPDEQGRGYGTDLLERLLDRLRADGVETIRLTARVDDERARAFYERSGFAATDEIPNYYEDCDGVVLVRKL